MGIIHIAYRFDRSQLREILARCVDPVGDLDLIRLTNYARLAWSESSVHGLDYLAAIAADREDLEGDVADASRIESLLKTCVALTVTASCGISNASFAILESILPELGWMPEHVRLLLVGRRFFELIECISSSDISASIYPFYRSPSWVPESEASKLYSLLERTREQFLSPGKEVRDKLEELKGKLFLKDPNESEKEKDHLLANAFSEAKQRLDSATKFHSDLILQNDITSYAQKALEPL